MTLLLPLRSGVRKAFFLLGVAVPSLAFAVAVARIALADTWGGSDDIVKVRRAVSMDPSNENLHYMLALRYLADQPGPQSDAVGELNEAVRLNPRKASFWFALGKACYLVGDQGCADQALRRATELAPSKPRYVWEVVLNHAMAGRQSEAAAASQHFLRMQPEGARNTFDLLLRAGVDPESVWRDVAHASGDITMMFAFLDLVARGGEFELAARCWNSMTAAGPQIPYRLAEPYLERLVEQQRFAEGVGVWNYLLRRGSLPPNRKNGANLVFNGDFSQPPLDSGFDWRLGRQRYLTVEVVDAMANGTPRRALRIDFTVPYNSEYEPAYQWVPVVPGQQYLLRASVRSEEIRSDSGPRFRVLDPRCPDCTPHESTATTGTSGWHEVTLAFQAGPETEAVRLSVWRPRARSFPMEIAGRFLVSDVSLQPVSLSAAHVKSPAH